MAQTAGYPSGATSTSAYSAPATGTLAAGIDTLELYDNSEVSLINVSATGTAVNKFMTTLLAIQEQSAGGKYSDAKLADMVSNNYPEIRFKEIDDVATVYTGDVTGYASGATTIGVVSTAGLQRGDILRVVATNENVRVASVTNSTTLVVVRGVGTIAAAAIAANAVMIFVGNSIAVGEAGRSAFMSPAQDKTNYIQKFVTSVATNEADTYTAKVGGNKKASNDLLMKTKYIEHLNFLERSAVFGQKYTGTDATSSTPYYNFEGALHTALRGWTGDLSGSVTAQTLSLELGRTMIYGEGTKIGLCGTKVLPKLHSVFETRIQTETIESVNLKITTLELNSGKIVLVTHPYMDSNSGYDGHIIMIDPSSFTTVYPSAVLLDGSSVTGKTRFEYLKDQSNYASQKGDYVTMFGFKNANANANGVFKIV